MLLPYVWGGMSKFVGLIWAIFLHFLGCCYYQFWSKADVIALYLADVIAILFRADVIALIE